MTPDSTVVEPEPPRAAVLASRWIAAPREQVWSAWTTPAVFERWFRPPMPGGSNAGTEMDVRPGGALRIAMKPPVGWTTFIVGTYLHRLRSSTVR